VEARNGFGPKRVVPLLAFNKIDFFNSMNCKSMTKAEGVQ
jgi:hypothetical protein